MLAVKRFYASDGTETVGPFKLSELREFLSSDEGKGYILFCEEGDEWKPISRLRFLDKISPNAVDSTTIPAGVLEIFADILSGISIMRLAQGLLEWVRKRVLPLDFVETFQNGIEKAAGMVLFLSGVLILGVCTYLSIRDESWLAFGLGATYFAIVIPLLLLFSHLFLSANRQLASACECRIRTRAVLDGLAIVSLVLILLSTGITIFICCDALGRGQADEAFLAIVLFAIALITLLYLTTLLLHPESVNAAVTEHASPGQEAIGLLAIGASLPLRLVSLPFVTGALIGDLIVLNSVFSFSEFNISLASGLSGVGMGLIVVFLSALLPFVAYVTFLQCFLIIDLLRSILHIPDLRLDQ